MNYEMLLDVTGSRNILHRRSVRKICHVSTLKSRLKTSIRPAVVHIDPHKHPLVAFFQRVVFLDDIRVNNLAESIRHKIKLRPEFHSVRLKLSGTIVVSCNLQRVTCLEERYRITAVHFFFRSMSRLPSIAAI